MAPWWWPLQDQPQQAGSSYNLLPEPWAVSRNTPHNQCNKCHMTFCAHHTQHADMLHTAIVSLQADRHTSHPMAQGLLQQACFASSPTWRPCSLPCSSSSSMVPLSRAASHPSISQHSPVQGQG